MKLTTELLRETALYIQDYYNSNFNDQYCFHQYNRTINIVRHCDALASRMDLGKQESKLVHLAAWFLETGYCIDYQNAQVKSAELAAAYYKEKGVEDEKIETIVECILSTRMPMQAVTATAQIVCDASMYHLAEKDAHQILNTLRTEYAALSVREFTDEEWIKENVSNLSNHFYFTSAARKLYQKGKSKSLAGYKKNLELLHEIVQEPPHQTIQVPATEHEKIVAEGAVKLERGVETFFRITEQRHMELAARAHEKASLLISINAIVISIVLSVLITKLDESKYLLLPTLLLIITASATIIFSILSTRPKLIKDSSKHNPVAGHEMNIIFFGDFAKLSLDEYKKSMQVTYKNRATLYDSLSKDIYYQGIILVWKYKYINIAYNIFMYGFIITILAFIAAYALHTAN